MLILARPLAWKFSSSSVDGASARGDGGDLPTPTLVLPPAWKIASPLTVVAVFGMARTAAVGRLDELPVVKRHALGCSAASAGATLAGGGQGFRGGVCGEGVTAAAGGASAAVSGVPALGSATAAAPAWPVRPALPLPFPLAAPLLAAPVRPARTRPPAPLAAPTVWRCLAHGRASPASTLADALARRRETWTHTCG